MENYKNGYEWSRDYNLLKQLLDEGYEVVCLADYDWHDGTISRDICVGRLILGSTEEHDHYSFSCRGIAYCELYPSWYKDQNMTEEVMFRKAVSRANIEFINIDEGWPMSKISKTKRAEEGWKRLFDDLIKHKDLNRFFEKQSVYTKIYGEMSGLHFYTTRYYAFHKLIVPKWLSSSNIENRNYLYDMTKKVFGDGLANELQRISSKRTW